MPKMRPSLMALPLWLSIVYLFVILFIDFYTPLGIAVGVLYVPFVLFSVWFERSGIAFIYAGVASFLIIVGYFLAPHFGVEDRIVMLNRVLSVMAVWVTAFAAFTQKSVQEKLSITEERQRLTLINAPIGMALVGLDGKWLQVNPALCDIVGYSEAELLAIDFQTITHADDLDDDLDLMQKLNANEITSYEIEKRYIHKEGHIVWALLTVGVMRDRLERPLWYISQILNITDRKGVAKELEEVAAFKELVTNTIPDLVFVKDNDLRIVQANEAFLNVYPAEQRDKVIGFTTFEAYQPDQVAIFSKNDLEALEKGYHETEEIIQFPNGQQRTLFTKKLRFEDDGKYYVLGVSRDITSIKRTQKELEQANAELEKFSYIASHDLKAPLRGIDNLAQWIYEDLEHMMDDGTKERMVLLRSRVKRLESMLRDILEYSRVGRIVEKAKHIELSELLPYIVEGLGIADNYSVLLPDDLPAIYSPLTPLEQIFSNLLTNAAKHHDKPTGEIQLSWKDCDTVLEFSVQDDGPGIPEEYQERVFTLFQTLQSRDVTEGSGLGMSIIKKLVELQGGEVFIDSKDGQRGTIIRFTWPKTYQLLEEDAV